MPRDWSQSVIQATSLSRTVEASATLHARRSLGITISREPAEGPSPPAHIFEKFCDASTCRAYNIGLLADDALISIGAAISRAELRDTAFLNERYLVTSKSKPIINVIKELGLVLGDKHCKFIVQKGDFKCLPL